VIAGLEMMAVLDDFNRNQIEMGAPEFKIGVGVNYGIVTVGNIGCEKKMNYTVIGDTVNLASRLEGLTKMYKEPILFAETVFNEVSATLPCRVVDRVAVKGKTLGVPIYTARLELTDTEQTAWKYHNDGAVLYYRRQFGQAEELFKKALSLTPGDPAPLRYLERCEKYLISPPPADWDGVEIMTEK
jgi:tetratricopeptide (TPR) repeat protein